MDQNGPNEFEVCDSEVRVIGFDYNLFDMCRILLWRFKERP